MYGWVGMGVDMIPNLLLVGSNLVLPGSPFMLSSSTLAVPHLATRNLARKGAFAALCRGRGGERVIWYRIAGNFRGVQLSRMASLPSFCGLIFADACDHAHYIPYNRTYFAGLIFADSRLSAKTAKIGPHENFPLYGNVLQSVSLVMDTWYFTSALECQSCSQWPARLNQDY